MDALRDGKYQANGAKSRSFDFVALAGHSAGGAISELTAYSFENIDALIIIAWADQGASGFALQSAAIQNAVCANGGEQSDGADDYAFLGQSDDDARKAFFFNAKGSVVKDTLKMRNREPCGDAMSILNVIAANLTGVPTIDVPTLLVYGENDSLFPPPAGQNQRDLYTNDPEFVQLENTAHAVTLERTRNRFRKAIERFLEDL